MATRLADRLRSGENLAEILQRDELAFPPVWRSVVLAGLRSGHLPAALEGLSQTVRRAADVRRSIAVSLIYPFVVVAIAFGFLLFSLTYLAPVLANVLSRTGIPSRSRHDAIGQIGASVHIWAPWVPIVLALVFLVWWYRSGRAIRSLTGSGRARAGRFLFGRTRPRRWPSVGQAMRDGRMATFAELLRLMNDHQVPMPEAVVLAADASGDRALSRGARQIAERLEGGEVLRRRSECRSSFRRCWAGRLLRGPGRRGWVGRCLRPPRCTDSALRERSGGRRCICPSC